MSILYIRLPSKAGAESTEHASALGCPFALVSTAGTIEREGNAALSDLSTVIGKAKRVVLLLAAADVTLLRITVPPLSASRLKSALPGLVEEQLMSDPSECVMVAAPATEPIRTVAVIQRSWLELLAKTLFALGARNITALPAQLCLPHEPDTISAAVAEQDTNIDVALRLSQQHGIGLSIAPDQQDTAAEVIASVTALAGALPVMLYVPQSRVPAYQRSAGERMTVIADNWQRWLANARGLSLNLMSGLNLSTGNNLQWRRWRWPAALAAAIVVINIVGLNIDWLRTKREADALRGSMVQIYRSVYPKETAILDPVLQMQQKIATARRNAGQSAQNDFAALVAAFGEAWSSAAQGRKTAGIASMEYRDNSLSIRLKADGEMPIENVRSALAARGLALTQPSAGLLQIRGAK